MADPSKLNRHGREIWFRESGDGGGAYAPVHRNGCLAFVLAACWIVISGLIGMTLILFWQNVMAVVAMLAIGAPGLILLAITVRRHS